MNYYTIYSPQPNCKTCGKPLKEWNPFANEHEHPECAGKRIADEVFKSIKKQLNQRKQ